MGFILAFNMGIPLGEPRMTTKSPKDHDDISEGASEPTASLNTRFGSLHGPPSDLPWIKKTGMEGTRHAHGPSEDLPAKEPKEAPKTTRDTQAAKMTSQVHPGTPND